jgi:hypothetical protein
MLDPANDVLAVQLNLVNFLTFEQRHLSRVSTLDFVNPRAARGESLPASGARCEGDALFFFSGTVLLTYGWQ